MNETTVRCDSLAPTWFEHPEWWFSKDHAYDTVITNMFGHLLDGDQNNGHIINQVLVWDQLPRHVYRNTQSNHVITYYLHKAITLLQNVATAVEYASSDAEFMFLMLPFRHTQNMKHSIDVMKASWKWKWQDDDLMRKFMRATYTNSPVTPQYQPIRFFQPQAQPTFHTEVHSEVLDKNQYSVSIACAKELSELQIPTLNFKGTYIVSLSGGVDSMVMLHILLKSSNIPPSRIACVYIDYDNKPTSPQETLFVIDWCRHIRVPLYVRTLSEIHRAPCMNADLREVYETYTKRVRFATYKAVHEMINFDVLHTQPEPYVLLGHNKDDCFENILTNVTSRAKYENLKGMTCMSCQDGVYFLRPMLHIAKKTIIAFARGHNIPFLCDSTPAWSQRGKIRDTIVPALQTWNSESIGGFLELSDIMTSLYSCMETHIDACRRMMHTEHLDDTTTQHTISLTSNICHANKMFWKVFLYKAFQQVISHKSLTNFIQRISHAQNTNTLHIVLNTHMHVYVKYKNTQPTFIFHVQTRKE